MLRPAPHIRYHIAAILAAHPARAGFVVQYKRWITHQEWGSGILEFWNIGQNSTPSFHDSTTPSPRLIFHSWRNSGN